MCVCVAFAHLAVITVKTHPFHKSHSSRFTSFTHTANPINCSTAHTNPKQCHKFTQNKHNNIKSTTHSQCAFTLVHYHSRTKYQNKTTNCKFWCLTNKKYKYKSISNTETVKSGICLHIKRLHCHPNYERPVNRFAAGRSATPTVSTCSRKRNQNNDRLRTYVTISCHLLSLGLYPDTWEFAHSNCWCERARRPCMCKCLSVFGDFRVFSACVCACVLLLLPEFVLSVWGKKLLRDCDDCVRVCVSVCWIDSSHHPPSPVQRLVYIRLV